MAGDIKVAVLSGQLNSSGTGFTDFTKSGFGTPKACLVILTPDAVDDVNVAVEGTLSVGLSDFTSNYCISHQDEDASAKVDCGAIKSNTKSYILLTPAAAVDIDGAATTVTDGVRLTNTTNVGSTTPFVTVVMFGGVDLAADLRRTVLNNTVGGTTPILHSGLTEGNEKLIFFVGTDISAENSSSTGINNSFGVCHTEDKNSFSVASEGTAPTGIAFRDNGLRMYVCDSVVGEVRQYTLSVAWDVSTASYDSAADLDVTTQDTAPTAITLGNSGSTLFVLGTQNNSVYQYTLSTAWDLGSATYDSGKDLAVGSQDTSPNGLSVRSDGTDLYVVGDFNDKVYQYSLSTGWDLGTATYDGSGSDLAIGTEEATPSGVFIRQDDGTRLYVTGQSGRTVFQYNLSTAYNLATAVYAGASTDFDMVLQDNVVTDIFIGDSGNKLFMIGDNTDRVFQYDLSTAWIPSTGTLGVYTQRCLGWSSDHNNNAGSPNAIVTTNRVLDILGETGTQDWAVEVTRLSHNDPMPEPVPPSPPQWTVVTREASPGASMEVYSLALDLDDRKAKVASVDGPTAGATWVVTGMGFKPQYVGLGLTELANEDTIDSAAESGAMGISSNAGTGEETFHGWYNEDAAATINANNNFRSRVLDLRDHDVDRVVQDHSHSSFDSAGFTYTINTENETVVRKWFYWAIEEVAGAGPFTGDGDQTLPFLTQVGVGLMHPDGDGDQALPAVVQVGTGAEEFIGAGVQTLFALLQAGVGVMQPDGDGDQTLPAVIQVGTGEEEFAGAGVQTLFTLLQAGAGAEEFIGSGVQTLFTLLQAGVGLMHPDGAGAQTLFTLLQDGTGVQVEPVTSTGDQTLFALLQSGVGVEKFIGSGVQTLFTLLQNGVGVMQPDGDGDQALPAVTQVGTGAEEFIGSGGQTLFTLLQAGVGLMHPDGDGDQTLPLITQIGTGLHTVVVTSTGDQTLFTLLQNGVGLMHPDGSGVQTLFTLLQAGAGIEEFIGAGVQTLPLVSQDGTGASKFIGAGIQILPAIVQSGVGIMQPDGAGVQTLFTLLQSGVGVEEFIGAGDQTLFTLLQAGVGVEKFIGSGIQILPAVTQSGVGAEHYIASGVQALFTLLQAGSGSSILNVSGTGVQALFTLLQVGTGAASGEAVGVGVLILPFLNQDGKAIAILVVLEFIPVKSVADDVIVVQSADITVGSSGSIGI